MSGFTRKELFLGGGAAVLAASFGLPARAGGSPALTPYSFDAATRRIVAARSGKPDAGQPKMEVRSLSTAAGCTSTSTVNPSFCA